MWKCECIEIHDWLCMCVAPIINTEVFFACWFYAIGFFFLGWERLKSHHHSHVYIYITHQISCSNNFGLGNVSVKRSHFAFCCWTFSHTVSTNAIFRMRTVSQFFKCVVGEFCYWSWKWTNHRPRECFSLHTICAPWFEFSVAKVLELDENTWSPVNSSEILQ